MRKLTGAQMTLRLGIYLIMLHLTIATVTLTDQYVEDKICGSHPLRDVIKDIKDARPNIPDSKLLVVLRVMRQKMPVYWAEYEERLNSYKSCLIETENGPFG